MPATVRYTCLSCRAVFRAPDFAVGTAHTCPFCKQKIVLRRRSGRTILEMDGVDSSAPTRDDTPVPTTEEVNRPAKRIAWLAIPAAVLVLSLLFCGVAAVVRFWPREEKQSQQGAPSVVRPVPPAKEKQQEKLPHLIDVPPYILEISPEVDQLGIELSDLKVEEKKIVGRIKTTKGFLGSTNLRADSYDQKGIKLDGGYTSYPDLVPGEIGKITIGIPYDAKKEDVAMIVLRKRH